MPKFIHPRWHHTFLGIYQQHIYWLYKVIDDILNENPQIEGIIEIGTGDGALSVFLALETFQRKYKQFITNDIVEPENVERLFGLLDVEFIKGDCFKEEIIPINWDFPVLFFCDGGNKAKEFNFFVSKLKSDSIIAVHDWDREVFKENLDTNLVEPIKKEEWNQSPDNILTSFWKVK